mmetsp:Transcript_18060/g.53405  ORF Transcript_18060/g.53405 Transcript_18060/m.53405 type:complete len:187 (+) Transcript_18060:77-637(+)
MVQTRVQRRSAATAVTLSETSDDSSSDGSISESPDGSVANPEPDLPIIRSHVSIADSGAAARDALTSARGAGRPADNALDGATAFLPRGTESADPARTTLYSDHSHVVVPPGSPVCVVCGARRDVYVVRKRGGAPTRPEFCFCCSGCARRHLRPRPSPRELDFDAEDEVPPPSPLARTRLTFSGDV